jgi:hypothetical protein
VKLYIKDPAAKLDYMFDWTEFLGADTIQTSTWTIPSGLTSSGETILVGDLKTKIFLAGGTLGKRYEIQNKIVTVGGREELQTFYLLIENT